MGKKKHEKQVAADPNREPIPPPVNVDEFLATLIQEFYKPSVDPNRRYSFFNLLNPLIPETDPTLSEKQVKQFAQNQANSVQTQLYEESLETLFVSSNVYKQADYNMDDKFEMDLINLEGIAISQFDKAEQRLILRIFDHWIQQQHMPKRFKRIQSAIVKVNDQVTRIDFIHPYYRKFTHFVATGICTILRTHSLIPSSYLGFYKLFFNPMEAVVKRFLGDSARNASQTLHVCFIDLGLNCALLNHASYQALFQSNPQIFNGIDKVIADLFTDLQFTFHTPTSKQLEKEQREELIKAAGSGIVQCPISPLLAFFALVDLIKILEKNAGEEGEAQPQQQNDQLDAHLPNGGSNTCFLWKDELVLIASSEDILRKMVIKVKNYVEERKLLPIQYAQCAHAAFQWVDSKQVKAVNAADFRVVQEDEKTSIPMLTVAKSMNVEILKPMASLILSTLK